MIEIPVAMKVMYKIQELIDENIRKLKRTQNEEIYNLIKNMGYDFNPSNPKNFLEKMFFDDGSYLELDDDGDLVPYCKPKLVTEIDRSRNYHKKKVGH